MSNDEKSIIGLGIDQGIANCGYSVVEMRSDGEITVLKSGTIETNSSLPLPKRMTLLYSLITDLVETHRPVIIGCEKLFFNPKQKGQSDGKKGRNKSAAIVYTNMATGLLCLIAGQNQIELQEFVPGTVKKYVAGSGKAQKEDIEEAIKHLLKGEGKTLSHETDAIAIAITAVKAYADRLVKPPVEKKKRKKKGVIKDVKKQ